MKQIFLCGLSLSLLVSCGNQQEFKELKKRKKELDLYLTAYYFDLNHRADAIKQIGTLSEELKAKYHYDSLVRVQSEQTEEYKKMEIEKKSIQEQLDKIKH